VREPFLVCWKRHTPLVHKIWVWEFFSLFYIISTQISYIYKKPDTNRCFAKLRAISNLFSFFWYTLYNKQNITRWLEDMTFIFSCKKQYFTHSLRSFVKYCFHHSKIKVISSRRRVISSIYHISYAQVFQWHPLRGIARIFGRGGQQKPRWGQAASDSKRKVRAKNFPNYNILNVPPNPPHPPGPSPGYASLIHWVPELSPSQVK
jgi:hypothetical protein